MAIVSITRLRVRSWVYMPAFVIQAACTSKQAAAAEGNLAVRVLREPGNIFWTATSWSSAQAVTAYMLAAPHGPVMKKLMVWCDEAAVVRWEQDSAELPAWDKAHRRLQQEGRLSKVHHPSPAHTAHAFPAPASSRSGERRSAIRSSIFWPGHLGVRRQQTYAAVTGVSATSLSRFSRARSAAVNRSVSSLVAPLAVNAARR